MKLYKPIPEMQPYLSARAFYSKDSKANYLLPPSAHRRLLLEKGGVSSLFMDVLADMENIDLRQNIEQALDTESGSERKLQELFDQGFHSYRVCIFMGLTVLDTAPFSMVLEFADLFHEKISEQEIVDEIDDNYQKDRFNISRLTVLEDLEAEECKVFLPSKNGDVLTECVRFSNPDMSEFAYGYIWKNYLALRPILLEITLKFLNRGGMAANLDRVLCDWGKIDPHYAFEKMIQPLVDMKDTPQAFVAARVILCYLATDPNIAPNVLSQADRWWRKWREKNMVSRELLLAVAIYAVHGDLNGAIWAWCFKLIEDYAEELFRNRAIRSGTRVSLLMFFVFLFEENQPLLTKFVEYVALLLKGSYDEQELGLKMLTVILYTDAMLLNEDRQQLLLARAVTKRYVCFEELSLLLYKARNMYIIKQQHQMILEEQLRFVDMNQFDYGYVARYYQRMAFLDGAQLFDSVIEELKRINEVYQFPCEAAEKIRTRLLIKAGLSEETQLQTTGKGKQKTTDQDEHKEVIDQTGD